MIPKPGRPVRGSRTGRPLMALLDLLGRRWTLRVLWELRRDPLTFAELQRRCDAMSPSVLNQRISELRQAHIIAHTQGGYRLTAEGESLLASISPLDKWAKRWARGVGRPGD
jgi:DNA-binding HxlR family transcriptional regulator